MSTISLSSGPPIESYASKTNNSNESLLSDAELTELYLWVDSLSLSRPKKNFTRDFSDACLLAEIIHSFHPKWVDLHNYPPANSTTQKIYNWNTLNFKVLRKLRCCLNEETIHQIVHCKSGIVEKLLYDIKKKLQSIPTQNARKNSDSRSTLSTTSNHSSSSRPANLNSDFPKDDSETIMILKETVSLLQEKIEKLEYLIGLKDRKIEELMEYYSP